MRGVKGGKARRKAEREVKAQEVNPQGSALFKLFHALETGNGDRGEKKKNERGKT